MVRRGFGDAAKRIQELYLAGHKDEAIASVPDEWVDLKSLVGPPARIRERYRAWEDSGADSLSVRSRQPEAVEVMAKAARLNTDWALLAKILTSGEQASCVHPFASAPSTISATHRNRAWTCRACTPRSWTRWLCSTGSDLISCGSPSITSSMTATCLRGADGRRDRRAYQTGDAIERRLPAAVQPPGAAGRGPRGTHNISNGRIEVGVGMGYAPHEFRGFGLPVSRRVSLTDEGIEVWRSVRFFGRFRNLQQLL